MKARDLVAALSGLDPDAVVLLGLDIHGEFCYRPVLAAKPDSMALVDGEYTYEGGPRGHKVAVLVEDTSVDTERWKRQEAARARRVQEAQDALPVDPAVATLEEWVEGEV